MLSDVKAGWINVMSTCATRGSLQGLRYAAVIRSRT
jgi:hypothetical protein